MRKNRLAGFALAIAAGCVALGLVGCGDDDSASSAAKTATTTASTKTATEASGTATKSSTAASSATTSGSTPASSSTSSSSSGDDSLKNILKDTSKLTYKIVYDLVSTDDQGKQQTLTYTIVNKAPKTRIEFTSTTDASQSVIMIQDDKSTYLCTPSEKACIKTGSANADAGGLLPAVDPSTVAKDAEDQGAKVKKVADQTIAGQSSSCYEVTDSDGSGTMCVSKKDGVVLLIEGTFGGEKSSFKAKSYSTSVDDKEFDPPYKVTEIGG